MDDLFELNKLLLKSEGRHGKTLKPGLSVFCKGLKIFLNLSNIIIGNFLLHKEAQGGLLVANNTQIIGV